ncbi:unnamed protein product [Miscanthus lutarioriparius]|uniref:Uncharacterized protein n=1 Tax=Miscanthus lutarioriparius TaxID=422564 RepID=A0A811SBD8_9POAL|nr:unnamed protein product [Miscanthus lutarioriparius]
MGNVRALLHARGRWLLLLHCRHEHAGELPHHQRPSHQRLPLPRSAPRSRVCVQLPAGVEVSYAVVLAAHGDSVVVQVAGIKDESTDHFVYNAGDAAAELPRPPSLSLLAPHSITYEEEKRRPRGCHYLDSESTGLLRRGEDDFLHWWRSLRWSM